MSAILPPGLSTLIKTLRTKWDGEPLPERCIVTFWHSRMIGGWWLARKNAVALVSKSNDGEHLAKVLTKWEYRLTRGSSSHDGKEALNDAIEMVRSGEADRLVLTPDGPRGPREEFKRGAFIAAKELGIPLIFLRIRYRDGMKLMKSWDRFEIPYPLSTIEVQAETIDISSFPIEKEKQIDWLQKLSEQFKTTPSR